MACPKCGASSDAAAKFCVKCGASLDPAAEMSPAERRRELYKAVIGPKNQDYYLSRFERFDEDDKAGMSWHWPAFFVTFFWFLYRRMWKYGLIYFFAPYLILVPVGAVAGIMSANKESTAGIVSTLFFIAMLLLPPLYANALYYRACKKRIANAEALTPEYQRQLGELSGRGGTSGGIMVVAALFMIIPVTGILAAIALPAYQDYTVRAKMTEAIAFGDSAARSVGDYYRQQQKMPSSLREAGFTARVPASVSDVALDQRTGVIEITVSPQPIAGQTLHMTPSVTGDSISWRCSSDGIKEQYLPRGCRP
jgi:Tfp pilus assembly protein PilE